MADAGARNTSKLLGGGALSSITKSFGGKGVDSISKTLDGIQQFLNIVQSTTPLIQEYGPMVKNLPAMYRMAKAFKEFQKDDAGTQELEEVAVSDEAAKPPVEDKQEAVSLKKAKPEQIGPPRPKLYV